MTSPVLLACCLLSACLTAQEYLPPRRVGTISDPRLQEISGIVPVKGHESYYWVHNDSGDLPRIFALHESGVVIAEVAVTGAQAVDWEDIAAGPSPQDDRKAGGKDFEEIFRERGVVVPSSLSEIQGECIAYDHAGTGYVTAGERPSSPIHHVFPRKQPREK